MEIFQLFNFYTLFGKSLNDDIKVNEAVISLDKYEELLIYFRECDLLILGGDLYVSENDKMKPMYLNWSYEGEDLSESIVTAREYLFWARHDMPKKDIWVSYIVE